MEKQTIDGLNAWFLANGRILPWRKHPDPYAIWVSEIMLQQTQVSTVIPYFNQFMKLFPSVEVLAQASEQEVIKAWEGLGYYSRARNLHKGAQYVKKHFASRLPKDPDLLAKIPGVGPYTKGAILNFAFRVAYPAVDGNVLRVLLRYYAMEDDISKPKTRQGIESLLFSLLPEEDGHILSEALIELGALVCTKQAKCGLCPLEDTCKARSLNLEGTLPIKTKKIQYEKLSKKVFIIQHEGCILIKKSLEGLMAGLYEFPSYEEGMVNNLDFKAMREVLFDLKPVFELPIVQQAYTRYRVTLTPCVYQASFFSELEGFEWKSKKQLKKLAFSSGHKKILKLLEKEKLF